MAAKLIDILLVENNPADIRLAQETLKDYKLQNSLHILRDGDAALDYLCRRGEFRNAPVPDLVMLDFSLPKVDGIDVLKHIRQDESLKDLPVVLLTASPIDERVLTEYNVAVDCAVLKPLSLERYLEAIRCFPQLGLSIVKIAAAS
jgi:CheY-like chemotaxis protein